MSCQGRRKDVYIFTERRKSEYPEDATLYMGEKTEKVTWS